MNQKVKSPKLWIIVIIFLLISLLGVGIMLYPIMASKYSESVRSEIYTQYEEVLEEVDTSDLDVIKKSAQDYNHDLFSGVFSPLEFKENGYYEQLKVSGTDVMCYVIIPKISVILPVYHTVGAESLEKGAGHMAQSSLPIGGVNTHAVISAHTGMAQSPMFSDLELIEIGDIFQVEVLGELLTYEVETIDVVLPQEIDSIQIQRERDLISLVTCTPYGVNSHRLVVRGHRIETFEETVQETLAATEFEDVSSVWEQQYWQSVKTGVFIAFGVFFILFILFFIYYRCNKFRKVKADKYEK